MSGREQDHRDIRSRNVTFSVEIAPVPSEMQAIIDRMRLADQRRIEPLRSHQEGRAAFEHDITSDGTQLLEGVESTLIPNVPPTKLQ
jgi:hypothetical protein